MTAPIPQEREFTTTENQKFDSEAKIMEKIHADLQSTRESIQELSINLHSERRFCPSCRNVIEQFDALYSADIPTTITLTYDKDFQLPGGQQP